MDINIKIKEVKERLKELTKNFPYTEKEINIFTICYIAMASIDNDITDLLDEIFSRVFILLNDGSYDNLIIELGGNPDAGGFLRTPDFDLTNKDNYEFICINLNKTIVFNHIFLPILFEYIMHEIKHTINEIVNGFVTNHKKSYSYCGIKYYMYDKGIYYEALGMLEEIFNSFITKIYLRAIKDLKKMDIRDSGIKRILNAFNLDDDYLYAYEATDIWEPLLMDQEIFIAFYNAALYRDYEKLSIVLADIFNVDMNGNTTSIDSILEYLDEISETYENNLAKEISDYFKTISSKYPKKTLTPKYYFSEI